MATDGLQLLTHPISLFPLRVAIALHEKDVPYEAVVTDTSAAEPAFLAQNPFGQIPVLVDGDVSIAESMAILEYLEEKYPEPSLLPTTLAERAAMRQLMNWSSDYWYVHWRGWLAPRLGRDDVPWTEASVEEARQGLSRHLDVLERSLSGRDWLVGDYSLADVSYGPLVMMLRRVGFGDEFEKRTVVAAWLDRLERRDAVRAALAAHAAGHSGTGDGADKGE